MRFKGFTLIEVLVALVILATAFMALIEVSSSHTSHLSYLRDKVFAHWVAMNKLAESRIAKTFPELGTSDGGMTMGKQEWFWEQTVIGTEVPSIRRVEVTVKQNKEDVNTVIKRIAFVQKKPDKKEKASDDSENQDKTEDQQDSGEKETEDKTKPKTETEE